MIYVQHTERFRMDGFVIRENGGDVHQPHDKGYKSLLSSKKVFMEFLRDFVDQAWVRELDAAFETDIEEAETMITNIEKVIMKSLEESRLEGKLEGKLEGFQETASRMLRMGFSLEQIEEATGLSQEEIGKLRQR